MDCPRCSRKIEKGWNFCPFCGYRPEAYSPVFGGAFGGILDKLMKRLAKQMEDIDRQTNETDFDNMQKHFDKNFEVLDLSPMFRDLNKMNNMNNMDKDMQNGIRIMGKPNARGFTIRIHRTNNNEPKVDVKTFGNVDDEAVQKQLGEQLKRMGISQQTRPVQPMKPSVAVQPQQTTTQSKQTERPKFPEPKITEEPKTNVKRVDSHVLVDMDITGVKSEEDIDINELESSVEVRAMAGDKTYFKILTKPERFKLSKKDFKNGKLHLEFA